MSATHDAAIGAPAGPTGLGALALFALIFIASAGGLAWAVAADPAQVPWGFIVANWVFLLGVSQFGVCFAAIMRICGARWSRPFHRVGELSALAFMPLAILGFVVIFAFGRHSLFHWLDPAPGEHVSPWLNEDLLFWRNLLAQLAFYGLAAWYTLLDVAGDVTERAAATGPAWRRWLYGRLARRPDEVSPARLTRRLYLLSPWILVLAVIANTFIAWDFGMMLFPHYHSTVFPMYFSLGNMFAGSAALLLVAAILSLLRPETERRFEKAQYKSMGILLTGFSLLWLYMFWAQFFVTWYGNLPHEFGPLWKQMYGHYGVFFWSMMICIVGLPIATLIFAPIKRMRWSMLILAVVMNVGVWLNRYLLVLPALADDHVPFSSFLEILVPLGLAAGYLAALIWLVGRLPSMADWEISGQGDPPSPFR